MRIYHVCFVILFTIISTYSLCARKIFIKKQTNSTKNCAQRLEHKPIIIFDLVNVLFKESYIGFAQKIGYTTLTSYALTHWKNPGHRCLDMLNTISANATQKPSINFTVNNRCMPRCIVELHEGKKTCDQTKTEIMKAIELLDTEKFFSSVKEKKLMSTIMNTMLDPQSIAQVTEPIKPMIQLAQKLKANGYTLYLFANIPEEFYSELKKKYPDILLLFNGAIISSHVQKVKPEKTIFEQLLTDHQLKPEQCILIDTAQGSVEMAKTMNMRGIIYEKLSQLLAELKKYGVIV